MRVKELLESISGVGKVRVQSLMERLNISPSRRIQGLGRHQLKELRSEFMKSEHAIKPGNSLCFPALVELEKAQLHKNFGRQEISG
jgi:ribosomal protein S13